MCQVQYQTQAKRIEDAVPAFGEPPGGGRHVMRTFQPHKVGAMEVPDGGSGLHI